MTKEEIYERYWKKLVQIRRVYTGIHAGNDTMYVLFKTQAVNERDRLLEKHGYEPFSVSNSRK